MTYFLHRMKDYLSEQNNINVKHNRIRTKMSRFNYFACSQTQACNYFDFTQMKSLFAKL